MYPESTIIAAYMSGLTAIVLFACKHWLARLEHKIDLLADHHANVDRRVARLEGAQRQ